MNHSGMRIFQGSICIICCLVMVISMFSFSASASGNIDNLADQILSAVESGRSSVRLSVPSSDPMETFRDMFLKYPALFLYYGGYSGTTYPTYSEVTMTLRNQNVPWDSVYVAHSLEDVRNLTAYSLSRLETGFRFVMVQGPMVTSDHIADFAHDMIQDHYFGFMGYHGNQVSYITNEELPLVSYQVTFHYWDGISISTLSNWRKESEASALHLASTLFAQDMPDYMKELLIHDWLVNNNRYNTRDTSAPESHMAYSALVSGNPVCQGYAEACLVLFKAAGIPVRYVSGDGTNSQGRTESHAWNCVQIQGQWYNLDTTWDDPTSQNGTDTLRYDYFNVTDSQLAQDHRWDRNTAPRCTATDMNYNRVRSLVDSDTGYYTDYSPRNVTTRDMTEAHFRSGLQLCARPDGSTPNVSEPSAPEYDPTPGYSQPEYDPTPGYSQPEYDPTPGYTQPGYSYPGYSQPGYSTQKNSDNSIGGILAGALAALGGIIALIFGASNKRRKQNDQGRRPGVYNPSDYD